MIVKYSCIKVNINLFFHFSRLCNLISTLHQTAPGLTAKPAILRI